tara:strand:- start:625 stop:969 length:345 start_codon:yes stop_codon:yes gene_type:complete
MTEYELQKAICKYLDLKGILYCASMGGQYQPHFSQRIKAKKSGYKKGFPDLFIYEPVGEFNGLAIELKVGKNRATKDQLKWQKELNDRGYRAEVCNGLDEAIDVIDNYLNNKIK